MASKIKINKEQPVLEKQVGQPHVEQVDPYQILLYPLSTEKSIRKIEFENKLAFAVHAAATKQDVKAAVEIQFKVKVAHVNLQNSFTGKKIAYVKLKPESIASDISADLGLI